MDINIEESFKVRIDLKGNMGKHTLTPRGLRSNFLNKLVKIEGIVTYMSKSWVRLLKSAHYCQNTNKFSFTEYEDVLNYNKDKNFKNNLIHTQDEHHNHLSFEYGIS